VRFTRGHFLDGQANLAGKIALKLLGAEEAGNAAFGFHGAIEPAVHFVKKGLTGSQLRKQERARIAVQRDSADGNQHGEYGRGFSPACEIAVCCRGADYFAAMRTADRRSRCWHRNRESGCR